MFCCTLLYVHSRIAIILMGKRELVALLNLSSWCLVMVEQLFLAVPRGCLLFVIVFFSDHTHLLFLQLHRCGRESWMLYNRLSRVLWLLVFCVFSSRCVSWSAECDCCISWSHIHRHKMDAK